MMYHSIAANLKDVQTTLYTLNSLAMPPRETRIVADAIWDSVQQDLRFGKAAKLPSERIEVIAKHVSIYSKLAAIAATLTPVRGVSTRDFVTQQSASPTPDDADWLFTPLDGESPATDH